MISISSKSFRLLFMNVGAQEYGSAFTWDPIDGIVGLGFSDLAVKTRPLLDTLLECLGLPNDHFNPFLIHLKTSK